MGTFCQTLTCTEETLTVQLIIAGVNCLLLSHFSKSMWFPAFSANTLPSSAAAAWAARGRGWAGFLGCKTDPWGRNSTLDCLGKQQVSQIFQLVSPDSVASLRLKEAKGGRQMHVVPVWVSLSCPCGTRTVWR